MGWKTDKDNPGDERGKYGYKADWFQQDIDKSVRFFNTGVISAKTLREQMPFIQDANERGEMKKYRAQFDAPEGHKEDPSYRWTPTFTKTDDLEAAELWITQQILSNGYDRAQAKIYEVEYTQIA